MATKTRQTAEVRREAVLDAARIEFARTGLHGASTDAIARRAGISQPYLFRLFGSKKELFLAVNDMCFAQTLDVFREAARGKSGDEALHAPSETPIERLIDEDDTLLQGQLQSYAAAVDDREVQRRERPRLRPARRLRRDGLGRGPPDDLELLRDRDAAERARRARRRLAPRRDAWVARLARRLQGQHAD